MSDEDGRSRWNRFESVFSTKLQEYEVKYDPRPTDVVIIGPVKSGTTWTQQILHQIRTKGDENFEDIYDVTWWLPGKYMQWDMDMTREQAANPRIFKSHEIYDAVAKCNGTRFVVVFRDPYDCEWSKIKFALRFFGTSEDLDEEIALAMYQESTNAGSDYCELLSTWYEHRNDHNLLWVHYEDLKIDLRFCIHKIAQFMQIDLNEEEVSRVHHFCTFEYMSKHETRFSGTTILEAIAKSIASQRWNAYCGMVRVDGGMVGQGRKHIGPKFKEAIDQRWAETMGTKFGFKDYDALFEETSFLKRFRKS